MISIDLLPTFFQYTDESFRPYLLFWLTSIKKIISMAWVVRSSPKTIQHIFNPRQTTLQNYKTFHPTYSRYWRNTKAASCRLSSLRQLPFRACNLYTWNINVRFCQIDPRTETLTLSRVVESEALPATQFFFFFLMALKST